MQQHKQSLSRSGGRWLADFALALALFWIVAFAVTGRHNHAHAVPMPAPDAAHGERQISLPAALRRDQASAGQIHALREARATHTRTLVLLGITFASLAALNLAFWRHLRRVYASPRRGVWRRD